MMMLDMHGRIESLRCIQEEIIEYEGIPVQQDTADISDDLKQESA